MNRIFHKVLNKFIVIYLDDILVYSSSKEEHLEHVRQVLIILQEAKLYTKLTKCVFNILEVEFYRHIVGGGKVQILCSKIDSI